MELGGAIFRAKHRASTSTHSAAIGLFRHEMNEGGDRYVRECFTTVCFFMALPF